MKLKEFKKAMALSIAVTMAMPTGVLAAGPGSLEQMQTEEGIGLQPQEEDQISEDLESQEPDGTEGEGSQESGETEGEGPQESGEAEGEGAQESGEAEGEGSQQPGETPEAYEARTGYVLPEGWHYVLDENGFVILLEDGSPKVEEDQVQQPGETPEAYEARTGYVLPEGWHYVLDENGFVVLMEDGSPAIEADQEPGNQGEEEKPSTNQELIASQ